ncbi:response regulator transcription factor [Empedobacter sedimenti]|uniref:response regulator transcription factor n=1 Tax=Empedobacter sedimenti TaxID=3042610 RepID=UPI0024A6C0EB|nr:LuxR C-terminal-related transcriptional regulator [Empedobacter sedimenti]
MKVKRHSLHDIWEQYPEAILNQYTKSIKSNVEHIVAEIFALGPFYYYMLNITNSTIVNYNEDILKIHGLKIYPKHLKEIIDLIHPEDIPFVREAENWTLEKMKEIGFEHQLNLKSGYCFRMKTENGYYELFQHQAIHSLKDENGYLIQAINIHTNIQHLTQKNNYVVTLMGIGNRTDFHQFHYKPHNIDEPIERLTKRELEILILLSRGYSDKMIADNMNISFHTVRTHHKNIMNKMNSKNGSELIKKSIESGYL